MSSTPAETTKNATSTQTTLPYAPAQGQIDQLLTQLGGIGPSPNRAPIAQDAYNQYLSNQAPTARGDFLDPNKNPFFGNTTSGITDSIFNRYKDLFAGSGRDPAGAGSFGQVVGKGVAEGLAPTFAGVYNTERGRQQDAISGLLGGGQSTAGLLSALDQMPLQQLGQKASILGPLASAFGTKTSSDTSTANTEQGTNWGQLAVGAATAAAIFF